MRDNTSDTALQAPLVLLAAQDEVLVRLLHDGLIVSGYGVLTALDVRKLFFHTRGGDRPTLALVDLSAPATMLPEFWVEISAWHDVNSNRRVLTFHVGERLPDVQPNVEIRNADDYYVILDRVFRQMPPGGAMPDDFGVLSTWALPATVTPPAPPRGLLPQPPRAADPLTPPATSRPPASPPTARPLVFVSYSRDDTDIARRVVQALQAIGIAVWLDHDRLTPGTLDWEHEVRRAITASAGVIYVASEAAATSVFVRDELNIARDNQVHVYPLWARGSLWSSCAPLGWGQAQYADGRGDRLADALLAIAMQLAKDRGV